MFGSGGRFYWGRKDRRGIGIAVLFSCPSTDDKKDLEHFVHLYSSLGWNSLLCHVDLFTVFLPERAASLACGVLCELIKEVKDKPIPIVLIGFSGGSIGCLYKVLQLVEGRCEGQLNQEDCQLVKDCICGQIYDSGPVDFTSDLGTRFALRTSVPKMSQPRRVLSWMAKTLASGLDAVFVNRFEAQRADYWQTLYSSVSMGPFLLLCSEDDDLAPCHIVCNFAQHLQELGGDVKLVKWSSSPHVAHYNYHQADYQAAVSEFFTKAAVIYSQRMQCNGKTSSNISESVCNLHQAAVSSNESLRRVAVDPSDHFFLPSSTEFGETREAGSLVGEQKADLFHLPSINPQGVLSQILFDVCVPKNIEGWDIKPVGSFNGRQTFASGRRHGPFNPIKCIRRSRL